MGLKLGGAGGLVFKKLQHVTWPRTCGGSVCKVRIGKDFRNLAYVQPMNQRQLKKVFAWYPNGWNVVNSVEKVDLPERVETLFQSNVSAWNIDSSSLTVGFDTFCSAQQNSAG